mmetsp:Transcript_10019/g.9890  ORF Transcript_10019/g.9890 Transcript_10019/m.9890 type:complete len:80 (+) Transcript_10019:1048-1287(+)
MPVSAYITFIDNSVSQDLCTFSIDSYSGDLGNIVLLGDSFLREYYIYHDVDGKRVGLYGRTTSSSHLLTYTTLAALLVF